MDSPGPFLFTLNGGAFSLAAAGVFVGDWMQNFAGIEALSLEANFAYGSGGASGGVTVYFQTSIDQGATPIDIFAPQFGQASAESIANLSALDKAPPFTPAQQSLTANAVQDGVLGDRFRAVLVVGATPYGGNSSLALWGCAR
jgi:hypothetical protein